MEEVSDDKMEEVLLRHKKEKKELQSKIQGLKKTVTKGDKKKKKEVQEAIAKLEQELNEKHGAELSEFKTQDKPADEAVEEEDVDQSENQEVKEGKKSGKVTKAQKRRDKKAAEKKEREKNIQEQEIENEKGPRNLEMVKIKEILQEEGLVLHEIEADGNCLYNAVAHQLRTRANIRFEVGELRYAVSKVMKCNPSEYLPFLYNQHTGYPFTEHEYAIYCDKIAKTTAWGGQLELKALSVILERPIKIIQADGPNLIMGNEFPKEELLTICYHRHMFKLGEHYNSVLPYKPEESTSESNPID